MLKTYERHSRLKLSATIVIILVVAILAIVADTLRSNEGSAQVRQTPTDTSSSASTTGYKNGTYTATVDYFVPHGSEEIKVSLTLQNDTISDVSIQNSENDFDSARYQEDFSAIYKTHVVGKAVGGLQIDALAGASDTTAAFNDAINQIASQAKT